jgi:hypothetical protein
MQYKWINRLSGAFDRHGGQLEMVGAIGVARFTLIAGVGGLMKVAGRTIEAADEPAKVDSPKQRNCDKDRPRGGRGIPIGWGAAREVPGSRTAPSSLTNPPAETVWRRLRTK